MPKVKANKLGCTHPRVVRRQRAGLWDAVMFRLGRYPWQCRLCGCRVYFADRRSRERADSAAVPFPASSWVNTESGITHPEIPEA